MQPVAGRKDLTRISVIVFSNSSYNKLPPYVVEEMAGLGFTAQSSDGQDLPYFKRYRIDKKEFSANQNKTYIDYLMQRCEELPPSPLKGRVVIECFGLTMNRGGGWFSFQPDPTGKGDATIVELEPNRTGFHVLELEVTSSQKLVLKNAFVNKTRFDIYKDEKKGTAKFSQWVDSLPEGRIAMITITDTAIAAKRPPGKELYTALQKLGASETMERIGYRQVRFLGMRVVFHYYFGFIYTFTALTWSCRHFFSCVTLFSSALRHDWREGPRAGQRRAGHGQDQDPPADGGHAGEGLWRRVHRNR